MDQAPVHLSAAGMVRFERLGEIEAADVGGVGQLIRRRGNGDQNNNSDGRDTAHERLASGGGQRERRGGRSLVVSRRRRSARGFRVSPQGLAAGEAQAAGGDDVALDFAGAGGDG